MGSGMIGGSMGGAGGERARIRRIEIDGSTLVYGLRGDGPRFFTLILLLFVCFPLTLHLPFPYSPLH